MRFDLCDRCLLLHEAFELGVKNCRHCIEIQVMAIQWNVGAIAGFAHGTMEADRHPAVASLIGFDHLLPPLGPADRQ